MKERKKNMKKELKALLESKEGTLRVNELFELRRVRHTPEEDILGRDFDTLRLAMTCSCYGVGILIESRDTAGIMREVEAGIGKLMTEYSDELARNWRGGRLR